MNIFLIPYTWMRHFAVALVTASAALVGWWLVLLWVTQVTPSWSVRWDGAWYLTVLVFLTAATSLYAESSLRRSSVFVRVGRALGGGLLSAAQAFFCYWLWTDILGPPLLGLFWDEAAVDLAEPTLVSLRYRLGVYVFAGLSAATGPVVFRRLSGFFSHFAAGIAAGLVAVSVWYILSLPRLTYGYSDLYLAGAASAMAFGGTFGFFAWGIPESFYAGWLRVVTPNRFGRRIPIDAHDGTPRERFVGHFPRGLDLFLPSDEGVMELHVSVMVTADQSYRLRGLTLKPTVVKRLLERIDLRYDPRRPAPLQTPLQSGDRIFLGPPENQTVVEFLMLPREER